MTEFKPVKGMNYIQRKKHADCNEEEKVYKIAYCKYLRNRNIKRDPEQYSCYNHDYNKNTIKSKKQN